MQSLQLTPTHITARFQQWYLLGGKLSMLILKCRQTSNFHLVLYRLVLNTILIIIIPSLIFIPPQFFPWLIKTTVVYLSLNLVNWLGRDKSQKQKLTERPAWILKAPRPRAPKGTQSNYRFGELKTISFITDQNALLIFYLRLYPLFQVSLEYMRC